MRGRDVVEVFRRRLVEPRVAESDVDEVLERRRFDARSLASSIFSRAGRVVGESMASGVMVPEGVEGDGGGEIDF